MCVRVRVCVCVCVCVCVRVRACECMSPKLSIHKVKKLCCFPVPGYLSVYYYGMGLYHYYYISMSDHIAYWPVIVTDQAREVILRTLQCDVQIVKHLKED